MHVMMTFREIRKAIGFSQTEMAESLGLHQSTISRLESGEIIPDKRTMLAARALLSARQSDRAA